MKFDASAFLRLYSAMDAALVAVPRTPPWPATSPWWNREIRRFIQSRRRRWVIRAGRRSGKSSTISRLAVAWARFGSWSVPPGDVGVIAIVSIDRDEAALRLRTIRDLLTDLGIPFKERTDEIELTERPAVFKVTTCSIRSVGFTCILLWGDEMARWESRETNANPAAAVMGSARPTMATIPDAFEVDVSSAWSTDDYHAQLVDAGDTRDQLVSQATTWQANPSITEARTRELEPDEKIWAREYANVPGGTISAAFDSGDVAACFGRTLIGNGKSVVLGRPFLAIDASSLRGDAFAFVSGHETEAGELRVTEVNGWTDTKLRATAMEDVVDAIAARAKSLGVQTIFGDQREEAALSAMFRERGVRLHSYAWTEASKDAAVQRLRRMMREGTIALCEHAALRRELTSMKARLMPSGRVRYETGGLDFASALITLMHAAVDGRVVPLHVDPDDSLMVIGFGRADGLEPGEVWVGGSGGNANKMFPFFKDGQLFVKFDEP